MQSDYPKAQCSNLMLLTPLCTQHNSSELETLLVPFWRKEALQG